MIRFLIIAALCFSVSPVERVTAADKGLCGSSEIYAFALLERLDSEDPATFYKQWTDPAFQAQMPVATFSSSVLEHRTTTGGLQSTRILVDVNIASVAGLATPVCVFRYEARYKTGKSIDIISLRQVRDAWLLTGLLYSKPNPHLQ
jgi:hypothetical protein